MTDDADPTGRDAARIATVLAYVDAVRDRPRRSLDEEGFAPDWADRPAPHTVHPGARELPLPTATDTGATGTLAYALARATALKPAGPGPGTGLTLQRFATALQLTAGVLTRRWQIDWNGDADRRARLSGAAWGRGTPSGGANYPWELYWAAAPGLPVPPGLLHYASGRHTLERLSTGDPTSAIRAALPADPAADAGVPTGGYLICTLRPWKTAFKYGNFAHHVATLDIGAFLGSWSLLRLAADDPGGAAALPAFDESAVNALLGLDPGQESAYALLPLTWDPAERRAPRAGTVPPSGPAAAGPGRPRPREKSRSVRHIPAPAALLRATAATAATVSTSATAAAPSRPSASESLPSAAPAGRPVEPAGPAEAGLLLPDTTVPAADLADLFSRRRSSCGRLDPLAPLAAGDLAAALHCAAAAAAGGGREPLLRIRVLAQRVEGIEPGAYHYEPARRALVPVGSGTTRLTEPDYAMRNYSVAHAGAVVAFTWRPASDLATHGPHGYRRAHAEAGAAAQYLSLAAQALGLGCGLALGIDPRAVDLAVGGGEPEGDDAGRAPREARRDGELRTALCAFLGARMPGTADLDDRLL